MSWERGVEVTQIWWLRIAQALGFPVVPEVKIKTDRSTGVAFAGGDINVGVGKFSDLRRVMEELLGGVTFPKDPRSNVKC